jgi:CRP/FNR family transcriptional regulator, cyclic AMP receptor protein
MPTGQVLRMCSATALTDCSLMRIEKKAMVEVLHREHAFSRLLSATALVLDARRGPYCHRSPKLLEIAP